MDPLPWSTHDVGVHGTRLAGCPPGSRESRSTGGRTDSTAPALAAHRTAQFAMGGASHDPGGARRSEAPDLRRDRGDRIRSSVCPPTFALARAIWTPRSTWLQLAVGRPELPGSARRQKQALVRRAYKRTREKTASRSRARSRPMRARECRSPAAFPLRTMTERAAAGGNSSCNRCRKRACADALVASQKRCKSAGPVKATA
jgi:hypothetical protein